FGMVHILPAPTHIDADQMSPIRAADPNDQQPHAQHLRSLLSDRALRLGGFYAKRQDRGSRDTWSTKTYLRPLEREKAKGVPVWAARQGNPYALDGSDDINVFVEGMGGNAEGRTLSKKRVEGARRLMDAGMDRDGRFPWAVGRTVPPGMMRLTMKATGRAVITFDSPAEYPSSDEVANLLPDVRHPDGRHVDQVENVRWFWENLPDLGLQETMRLLTERRYSTQTLRDQKTRGPSAYYGSADDPFVDPQRTWDPAGSWSRSLINNFEFYSEGGLLISLGQGEESIPLVGVFPPDGPWMTASVATRAKDYLDAQSRGERSARSSWSWSGFALQVNGGPATLQRPHDPSDETVRWRVVPDDGCWADWGSLALADSHLMGAITEALIAANGQPLRAKVDDGEGLEVRALAGERDRLEVTVEQRDKNLTRRRTAIGETHPDTGEFVMPAGFRTAEMSSWETDSRALEELRTELVAVQQQLAATRRGEGVAVAVLERIVNELRDPRGSTLRPALRAAVQNVELTVVPARRKAIKGKHVTLRGELRITHTGEPYSVPFSTDFETGAITKADDGAAAMATALRAGIVPTFKGKRAPAEVALVGSALGVPARGFALGRCQDSALLRLGMAALFPTPIPGEDPASVPALTDLLTDADLVSDFGDVSALVRNIEEAFGGADSRWLIKDGASFETWAILSGTGIELPLDFGVTEEEGVRNLRQQADRGTRRDRYARWDFAADQRPTVTPCGFCGSRLCAPMRIREVRGLLCLTCRRDESGVTWPDRFDAYLPSLDLWTKAGVVSALPGVLPVVAKGSKYRPLHALAAAELDQIASEYASGEGLVADIAHRHGVSLTTVYAIRSARALGYRYPGTQRRSGG
ncbi:hypothetical protein, partial [Nocardioides glacieisoli]|uniref:hypothetical protein n=1 Tax=Nocardioides glacieisoli TaxID=1168730 RepID=UPI0013EC48A6